MALPSQVIQQYAQPAVQRARYHLSVPKPVVITIGLLVLGLMCRYTSLGMRGLLVLGAAGLLVATWDRNRVLRALALAAVLIFASPAAIPEAPKKAPIRAENVNIDQTRNVVADAYACLASGASRFKPECYAGKTSPKKGGR